MLAYDLRILAIETSTHQGSVAICQEGQILFVEHFAQLRRENLLCYILEQAVKKVGRVHRVAVGIGPGFYNGIRAAISVAVGLKIAWKITLCGIPSILGIESPVDHYAVAGDARGASLFFGTVLGDHLESLQLLSPADFHKNLHTWTQTCGGPIYTAAPIPEFPSLLVLAPTAEKLASLTKAYPISEAIPSPLYLKSPYTTRPTAQSILRNNLSRYSTVSYS